MHKRNNVWLTGCLGLAAGALSASIATVLARRKIEKQARLAIASNERRIRVIIENMPSGLLVVTPEGYIESVNPAAEALFKLKSSAMVGRNISSFLGSHGEAARVDLMERLPASGRQRPVACKMMLPSGDHFDALLLLSALETLDGERVLVTIVDETERVALKRS